MRINIPRVLKGMALALAGAVLMQYPAGCAKGGEQEAPIPEEGEKILYSDTRYEMARERPAVRASAGNGRDYVLMPLVFRNRADNSVIFSSYVCLDAYAMPSGVPCEATDSGALAFGRESAEDFRLFDGVIPAHADSDGWLAFTVPSDTQSLHIDFRADVGEDGVLSFEYKL